MLSVKGQQVPHCILLCKVNIQELSFKTIRKTLRRQFVLYIQLPWSQRCWMERYPVFSFYFPFLVQSIVQHILAVFPWHHTYPKNSKHSFWLLKMKINFDCWWWYQTVRTKAWTCNQQKVGYLRCTEIYTNRLWKLQRTARMQISCINRLHVPKEKVSTKNSSESKDVIL